MPLSDYSNFFGSFNACLHVTPLNLLQKHVLLDHLKYIKIINGVTTVLV